MDEELYEDLPGGDSDLIQEELYDSIETYQQERLPPPKQSVPPPLPSVSTIPLSGPPLPARNDPPSLPPRNQLTATMSGSHTNAFPPPATAAPPPPPGPLHPPPPISPGVSPTSLAPQAHGTISSISAKDVNRLKPVKNTKPPPKKEAPSPGGIDMKTIQQEALKKRGQIDLEALEKRNKKDDSNTDGQAPPPWAGQLKRRKPADNISNASVEDKEEDNVAPWVRSKRGSFSEDAPAWVRKRLDSQSETTPPPIAKKPIKEKILEKPIKEKILEEPPAINGSIDSAHLQKPPGPVPRKPAPKPPSSPKPVNDSKPKPPIAPKGVSPKPSPTLPPRFDSLEPQESEKALPNTLPRSTATKKVPPPKPQRANVPPSPTGFENRSLQNEGPSTVAEMGPPSFTPELPTSPSSKRPTIPKRLPPPNTPAPPPPSNLSDEIGSPPFSPPKFPAPPPPMNQAPPLPPPNSAPPPPPMNWGSPLPPPNSAPPPPMNQAPPLPPPNSAPPPLATTSPPPPTTRAPPPLMNRAPQLPGKPIPALPPQVPQAIRYRRRPIPAHNAYTPPTIPDRTTKPGRGATSKPGPTPPTVVRPQIKAPIGSTANTMAPSLPHKPAPALPTTSNLSQKAPPPPPPAEEEFECDDFYDDVDTVKKAMPSAQVNQNPINITGVTTTESNVDEEEGELYDDIAGASSGMQQSLPPKQPAPPPPPPPELEQDDNYDLHPEEPIAEENYDLHPAEDQFEQDQTYEMPPAEPPEHSAAGNGDIPVEESFYETVTTDSKTLPNKLGASSLAPNSTTMPSPNMNKKLSKAELKEQKKKEKELEKERILQEKEKEKERILQEKEREKNERERKRLEELRQKNRKKYFIKNFKQFGFNPDAVPCIFATEAIKPNAKGKDHLILQGGEHIIVLLTSHEKLPDGKYLCEKTDGTVGFVDYKNLRDNVEGDCGQEVRSYPPPSIPAPPPPS